MSRWGLYVHVPWCRRRCPYCAFYVEAAHDVPWMDYVDAVAREASSRGPSFEGRARTVFLGGGTPSQLPPSALARLVGSLPKQAGAEVSAECNPEDCTQDWLAAAIDAGINRVSLGIQTFQPEFARILNRACTVAQAHDTARRVAASGLNSWSLDLIFALPGQTLEQLDRDLDAIEAVSPPHVALYGLTYEPGTPFTRARDQGRFTEASDGLWRAMYDRIVQRLRDMGLERYEVSNFAKPGHRCVHNQLYWTDAPYMGLGPSAHGYLPDGRRYHNVADASAYLTASDPTAEIETPDAQQAAVDLLVSGLRSEHGLDLTHMQQRTGLQPTRQAIDRARQEGLLVADSGRLRLTEAGYPVCDALTAHLADRLESVTSRGSGPPTA